MVNKYYLEGTENILNNYNEEDKLFIIKTASNLQINRLRRVTKKVFNGQASKLSCTIKEAVMGVNKVLVFYYNNLPAGFKRVPNVYELINEKGECLRFNRRVSTTSVTDKGYLRTNVSFIKVKKGNLLNTSMSIHRLVALAFIKNPNNLYTVNHIDCNKLNNCVTNLEWLSNEDNVKHAWTNELIDTVKLSISSRGELNSQAKLTTKDVVYIREFHKRLKNRFNRFVSKEFKVKEDIIDKILNKENHYLPRYSYFKKVKTSKGSGYFNKKVFCCQINMTDSWIRGRWNKEYIDIQKILSKEFNISKATIRDIIAKRSWNK